MKNFMNLSPQKLSNTLKQNQIPTVHWKSLYREFYKNLESSPEQAYSLPKSIKDVLKDYFSPKLMPVIESEQTSNLDGSVKFLIKLHDGHLIESVLMPESGRITLCLSSQVGCKQGCVFCHTGRMGLIRQLEVYEIIAQVWLCNRWIKQNPSWLKSRKLEQVPAITNLVFMGMGEPLDNIDHLKEAIVILTEPLGFYFSPKKISVSTSGHLDGLKNLLSDFPNISIAFSLHNPFDKERSKIIPNNKIWPLKDIVQYLASKFPSNQSDRFVLIQYTLIEGVNDSLEHAKEIMSLLENVSVKLNIIPLNPISVSSLKRPEEKQLEVFKNHFYGSRIRPLVRISKGQDILAACGQLVTKNTKNIKD